jgi:hypothetical protein
VTFVRLAGRQDDIRMEMAGCMRKTASNAIIAQIGIFVARLDDNNLPHRNAMEIQNRGMCIENKLFYNTSSKGKSINIFCDLKFMPA